MVTGRIHVDDWIERLSKSDPNRVNFGTSGSPDSKLECVTGTAVGMGKKQGWHRLEPSRLAAKASVTVRLRASYCYGLWSPLNYIQRPAFVLSLARSTLAIVIIQQVFTLHRFAVS